ncbi:MAG: hypothetical protein NTX98_00880 [Candidatus Doudnabacteria bacterium]|nr:hypothetical protein [Candidatus Doudnabacteria bacterium]
MINKNIDSLKVVKIFKPKPKKPVLVDSVFRPAGAVSHKSGYAPIPTFNTPIKINGFWQNFSFNFAGQKLPIYATVFLVIFGFLGGMWATLNTTKTQADEPVPPIMSQPAAIPLLPVVSGVAVANVPNDVLFNMTIEQLDIYLAEALKTPEMKEAERLTVRKGKLKEYLKEKKSPFVEIVDTLAELKHWKLVLAISNSESTLGKRCYNNNCSGIGVEPGHPLWRDYSTKAEWAKDLDRLLEKRYKDWTLEKMNGVYNKPGSNNWVLAAKQVLEDLEEREIE